MKWLARPHLHNPGSIACTVYTWYCHPEGSCLLWFKVRENVGCKMTSGQEGNRAAARLLYSLPTASNNSNSHKTNSNNFHRHRPQTRLAPTKWTGGSLLWRNFPFESSTSFLSTHPMQLSTAEAHLSVPFLHRSKVSERPSPTPLGTSLCTGLRLEDGHALESSRPGVKGQFWKFLTMRP